MKANPILQFTHAVESAIKYCGHIMYTIAHGAIVFEPEEVGKTFFCHSSEEGAALLSMIDDPHHVVRKYELPGETDVLEKDCLYVLTETKGANRSLVKQKTQVEKVA